VIFVERKLKKFKLPNGKKLVIHTNVLESFSSFRQLLDIDLENGGLLLGYQNRHNDSIIIDDLTLPQAKDTKTPISFLLKDKRHFEKIRKSKRKGSFFLGSWHTHPQDFVNPSHIDISDWDDSIKKEKAAADFMIFIIVGRKEIGVWVANKNQKLLRILEENN